MNAQIIPFRYDNSSEVRALLVDGEPWFVAGDVCDYFGVTNRNRALQALDAEDKGGTQMSTPGGWQTVTIINEPGLYSLLFSLQPQKARGVSDDYIEKRMESVRAFRRWVTHTVLPEIRKTGTYGTARALPQTYVDALRALADEAEAHELAKVRITELEPPARAWLHLVDATGDYAVGDVAKMLSRDPAISIGPNTLFRWMGKHGWLYRRGDDWHPYQERVDAGLLTSKANRPYWNSRLGVEVVPAPTVRVTAKGLHKLYVALGGSDQTVISDVS